MKSKKGLSGIVTTLIIILLVIVAVGVIWGVVNNLLGKSSGTIENAQRCLDVNINVMKVIPATNIPNGEYNLTLKRSPSGDGEVGVKVVFYGDSGNSEPMDFGQMFSPLETQTQIFDSGINATSVEITPYFIDDSGNENLCSVQEQFSFNA